jgi:5-methylcytosine-specific restriction endonuclease McrA
VGRRTWTNDQLEIAVRESTNYRVVLKRLNLRPAGGNYRQLKKYIRELRLATEHFMVRPWNYGLKAPRSARRTLEDLLTINSDCGTNKLKKKLFAAELKSPHCEECGWARISNDGRLPLELDHINGDPRDNRLENLRVLCPNCHSLKPTHRGCNRRRRPGGETGSHATLKMS